MSTGKGPSGHDVGDLRARLGLGVPQKGPTAGTPGRARTAGRRLDPGLSKEAEKKEETAPTEPETTAAAPATDTTETEPTLSLDPSQSPFGDFAGGAAPTLSQPLSGDINLLLGDDDDVLAGVGGSQRKKATRITIIVSVLVLIMGLAVGFFFGTGTFQRQIVNQKIDDSLEILKKIEPIVGQLAPILKEVKDTKSDKVDEELAQKLNRLKFEIAYDDVLKQNPIMGPLLTNHLMKFVIQTNTFRDMGHKHATLTLREHKSYLEQITQSSEALKDTNEVFIHYAPRPNPNAPPPKGNVVVPTGGAIPKGRSFVLPVKTLTGDDLEADIGHLIQLDKSQLIDAQGPNVMQLYVERVRDLQVLARDIEGYMTTLLTLLKKEAEKDHIIAF